jgi:hypothetical protein
MKEMKSKLKSKNVLRSSETKTSSKEESTSTIGLLRTTRELQFMERNSSKKQISLFMLSILISFLTFTDAKSSLEKK